MKSLNRKVQVEKGHYFNSGYINVNRLASYGYQFKEIYDRDCRSVIEVGAGAGVLHFLLKSAEIEIRTVDIDKDLDPDIVGSVTDIPEPANSVDAVVAFQVLEHLPFKAFVPALREMKRVAKDYVMISLPDISRSYRFDNWTPILGHVRFELRVPRINPPKHEYDGQHYWEIGKKGYSANKVKETIQTAGLEIKSSYRPWEYSYHHFFILKPKE